MVIIPPNSRKDLSLLQVLKLVVGVSKFMQLVKKLKHLVHQAHKPYENAFKDTEHHFLWYIATDPDRRGTGAGEQLMKYVMEGVLKHSMTVLYTWNSVNINFFFKFGFEIFSLAKNNLQLPKKHEDLPDFFLMTRKGEDLEELALKEKNEQRQSNLKEEECTYQEMLSVVKLKRPNVLVFNKEFLENTICFVYFREFLEKEKSEENLLLWSAVEEYKGFSLSIHQTFSLFLNMAQRMC